MSPSRLACLADRTARRLDAAAKGVALATLVAGLAACSSLSRPQEITIHAETIPSLNPTPAAAAPTAAPPEGAVMAAPAAQPAAQGG